MVEKTANLLANIIKEKDIIMDNKTTNTPTTAAVGSVAHPTTDQVARSLHDSVNTLHSSVASTEQKIREKSEESSEALKEQSRQLQAKWDDSAVKQYAYANPIQTVGIAFTAGVLLTMLLRGK